MKNKTLAIFGAGSYVLSVITSATDLDGNLRLPSFLIAISGIAMLIFTVMAVIRLWKGAKYAAAILAISSVLLVVPGSPILLFNIINTVHFVALIYAIIVLYRSEE